MAQKRRFFLALTVKNEAPNLLEWVAYHKMIGFTDIAIYQNDSVDGTQKILRTMEKFGYIQYFPNPDRQGAWQNKAYRRASRLDACKQAEWCMALDADEFLVIHAGNGTVEDLVDALPEEANCATIHWKAFGSSFHAEIPDGLVTEQFTLTEKRDRIRYRSAGFKSLFRPKVFRRVGIHKPKAAYDPDEPVYCNGSGILLDEKSPPGWRSKDLGMRRLAQVNHYALRDLQRFLVKSARGRTANHARTVDKQYWSDFDINDAEDTTVAAMAPRIRAAIEELDGKTRGRLGLLTKEGCDANRAVFQDLMNDPEYCQIYNEIIASFPHQNPAEQAMPSKEGVV